MIGSSTLNVSRETFLPPAQFERDVVTGGAELTPRTEPLHRPKEQRSDRTRDDIKRELFHVKQFLLIMVRDYCKKNLPMAEIISICNQKGGVGKTTTAVSLASCLAAAEKKTLLIDMDPQGNATTGIGLNKREITKSVYDLLIGRASIGELACSTEIGSLSILPSNNELAGAEVELVGMMSRETRLKLALKEAREKFDYIIIDCPPSLGLLTLNAMTAADSLLIPVQCEYYAMEGMADLYQTIQLVKAHLNPELQVKGIVLTMYDPRNNLSKQVAGEIREYFKETVFQIVIPRNVKLSEAPSYGKPILLYDVNSRGAKSYFALASELIQTAQPNIKEEKCTPERP